MIGADGTPPTAPSGLTAGVSGSTVSLSWTAATDNVARRRGTTSTGRPPRGSRRAPRTASRSRPGRPTATRGGRPARTTTRSSPRTPPGTSARPRTRRPRRCRHRRQGSPRRTASTRAAGTTTADRSGNGNTGTLSNATWSTAGKFGNALFFNGTNARVNVPDSNSLDLTSAMTLEAWVRPSITNASYRTVVMKEQSRQPRVRALLDDRHEPARHRGRHRRRRSRSSPRRARSRPGRGRTSPPRTTARSCGSSSTGHRSRRPRRPGRSRRRRRRLRIGGNAVWGGEWFSGWIDEVRVYGRALTAAEIQDDMNTSVIPDTTPPTVLTRVPTHLAGGRQRRHRRVGDVQRARCARAPSRPRTSCSKAPEARACPRR